MTLSDTIVNAIPLLRGRTGVEALTRKVPVVFRFYRGSQRVMIDRRKVKCAIRGNVAFICTHAVSFDYSAIGPFIDGISIAFDYPILDRIETYIPDMPKISCVATGSITIGLVEGALMSVGAVDD